MKQTTTVRSLGPTARILAAGLVAGGALLASGVGAFAMESAQSFMKAVNTNADSTISMKEVDDYAMERFAALDTEKDGKLSMAELDGRISPEDFKEANTKRSGETPTLSKDEFKAYVDHLFEEANTTVTPGKTAKTGTLSEKELEDPAGQKLIKLLEK